MGHMFIFVHTESVCKFVLDYSILGGSLQLKTDFLQKRLDVRWRKSEVDDIIDDQCQRHWLKGTQEWEFFEFWILYCSLQVMLKYEGFVKRNFFIGPLWGGGGIIPCRLKTTGNENCFQPRLSGIEFSLFSD